MTNQHPTLWTVLTRDGEVYGRWKDPVQAQRVADQVGGHVLPPVNK